MRHPDAGGGLEAQCKQCRNAASNARPDKRYKVRNKGGRTCKQCKQRKTLSHFPVNRANTCGRMWICSECRNGNERKDRRDRGLFKASNGFYSPTELYKTAECEICMTSFEMVRHNHKRCDTCSDLVRNIHSHLGASRPNYKRPSTVGIAVEVATMWYKSSHCDYCGGLYTSDKEGSKSLDHVIPVSRGGTNDPSNIKICHLSCNRAKARFTLDEWLDLCRRVCAHADVGLSPPVDNR